MNAQTAFNLTLDSIKNEIYTKIAETAMSKKTNVFIRVPHDFGKIIEEIFIKDGYNVKLHIEGISEFTYYLSWDKLQK